MKAIGYLVRGEAGELHLSPLGEAQPDDSFFVAFNASHEGISWRLPRIERPITWRLLVDTASSNNIGAVGPLINGGDVYELQPRSLALFIHEEPEPAAT